VAEFILMGINSIAFSVNEQIQKATAGHVEQDQQIRNSSKVPSENTKK
jgi:hypothetical protein